MSLFLFGLVLSVSHATVLNTTYDVNFVLTQAESPYYFNQNVMFNRNVTINEGVEIIFNGDYQMEVRGHLNACTNPSVVDPSIRGLTSISTAISFSGSTGRIGSLYLTVGDGATGKICNTKFSSLQYALSVQCCGGSGKTVVMNNTEFDDINVIFDGYSGSEVAVSHSSFNNFQYATSRADKLFYDCIFTNFDSVLSSTERVSIFESDVIGTGTETCLYGIFYNCLFTNFDSVLSSTERVSMFDCDLIGTGTETCLHGGRGTIQGVTVTNCDTAIKSNYQGFELYFNDVLNSNIGLITGSYSGSTATVYGNNFMNNVLNVQAPGSTDQETISSNYWGTSDESQIGATIEDICDLYSTALVTWWPYVTREIDFDVDVTSGVVDSAIISDLQSALVCNPFTSVSTLAPLYLADVTLTIANSPYYIKSDVVVKAIITIEAGVELIFTGAWTMEVRGVLDACPDPTTSTNTLTRGVYDAVNAITIRSNNSISPYGYIIIDTADGATASFCNTYFQDTQYALGVTCCGGSGNSVTIDNAEFENIGVIFDGYSGSNVAVHDSTFNNFQYATSRADKIFYNCLFTNFDSVLSSTERVSMFDCDLIGTGTETCLHGGRGTLQRVKITNCATAIKANYEGFEMYFNDILNSNIGLITGSYSGSTTTVYGNNFIGNTINVKAPGSTNQDKLCGNYWGTTDTSVIEDKIVDAFDGSDSTSIVTWNPYLTREIDFDVDLVSNGETFIVASSLFSDTTTCGATLSPTTPSPTTAMPTNSPITASPTTKPPTDAPTTAAPTTKLPTNVPTTPSPTTASPTTPFPTTKQPTDAPTTMSPTQSPLVDPTTDPTTPSPVLTPTTPSPADAPSTPPPVSTAPSTPSPSDAPSTPLPTEAEPTYTPTTLEPTSSPTLPCDAASTVDFDDPCTPDPGTGCGLLIKLDANVCVINGLVPPSSLEGSIRRSAKEIINGLDKLDIVCTEDEVYLKDVQVTGEKAKGLDNTPVSQSECPKVDELCGDEDNDDPLYDVDIVVAIRCGLSCDELRDVAIQLLVLVDEGTLGGTFVANCLAETIKLDRVCNVGVGRMAIADTVTVTLVDEQNNILVIHDVDINADKCVRQACSVCGLIVLIVFSFFY
eukprot:741631_1